MAMVIHHVLIVVNRVHPLMIMETLSVWIAGIDSVDTEMVDLFLVVCPNAPNVEVIQTKYECRQHQKETG